ncbi:MAG TPA: hypothetical protein VFS89_05255 [Nitrosospira sp.]|nr:hypothetical protein [Nitrosospira sp.]
MTRCIWSAGSTETRKRWQRAGKRDRATVANLKKQSVLPPNTRNIAGKDENMGNIVRYINQKEYDQ